jgi:hypothetical protein
MIRREASDGYLLFAQHDHAVLSGEVARHVGNERFARPSRGESSVLGVTMHDAGWPLHDDAPTINGRRQPIDVFESVPSVALTVWRASADRAEATGDAYAALLVSLHALSLSIMAVDLIARRGTVDRYWTFESNKFQHREIERQESLRKTLGLRTDRPLTHGLAEEGVDRDEDALRFDFRMLQALDQVSLAVCCTVPPFTSVSVRARPGAPVETLRLTRTGEWSVAIDPWPLDVREVVTSVPFRRVPRVEYESDAALRDAYNAAPVERVGVRIHEAG